MGAPDLSSICDECGSAFHPEATKMAGLCAECAHRLVGRSSCVRHKRTGRRERLTTAHARMRLVVMMRLLIVMQLIMIVVMMSVMMMMMMVAMIAWRGGFGVGGVH